MKYIKFDKTVWDYQINTLSLYEYVIQFKIETK